MKSHILRPQKYYYTFGPNEPALTVNSGDVIVTTTRDARGFDENLELIPEEQKQKSEITSLRAVNPLVGPIYIEEAKQGSTLAVTIQKIGLNRDSAWSAESPTSALVGRERGMSLPIDKELPEKRFNWKLDLSKNTGTLELENSRMKQIDIPLHPFIGSIGISPRYGRVESSVTPGNYGGNMDCIETKEGTITYFPVWVDGAYLALGDIHAAQGDGELCGVALETTAEVTIKVDVVEGNQLEWPYMEDEEYIMTTGSGRPLIDCVHLSYTQLIMWLVNEYGFDQFEAYQVVSQVGTMRIGNIVDPNFTVVAKFLKKYLPN